MLATRIRRLLLTVAVPATALATMVSLGAAPAQAQATGGANNANSLSNQMPAVSPAQAGPTPTATTKNQVGKRPARVVSRSVRPKHPGVNPAEVQHTN